VPAQDCFLRRSYIGRGAPAHLRRRSRWNHHRSLRHRLARGECRAGNRGHRSIDSRVLIVNVGDRRIPDTHIGRGVIVVDDRNVDHP
jgi:hypothetical protein